MSTRAPRRALICRDAGAKTVRYCTVSEMLTPQNGDSPHSNPPSLVLDTNTVLALWMFRDPALHALRTWIEAGRCQLYSREDAIEELTRVLAYRQFRLDPTARDSIQAEYRSRLTLTASDPADAPLPACSDRDDQKFLEIALLSRASTLLTRDRALLRLAKHRQIRTHFAIQRPEDFQPSRDEQAIHALPQDPA